MIRLLNIAAFKEKAKFPETMFSLTRSELLESSGLKTQKISVRSVFDCDSQIVNSITEPITRSVLSRIN